MKTVPQKLIIGWWLCLLALPALSQGPAVAGRHAAQKTSTRVQHLLRHLQNPRDPYVLVAAHRGDWRSFPENSLEAIRGAIDLGVDIVEIDVQKTRDGQLVLMHDATVDRTTTGKGKVSDYTLDSLKKLRLKNALGRATIFTVPTLEEAMRLARDRVLVNIDKGYDHFDIVYEILERTGTLHQAIFKSDKTAARVQQDYAALLKDILYMPIVFLEGKGAAEKIEANAALLRPLAMELVFATDTSLVLPQLKELPRKGARVWVNTMWGSLCGGREDDRALQDPEGHWGWVLRLGAGIIQTDRPQQLIAFLKIKGRRS